MSRSKILGNARVMSFENIKATLAKRFEKNAAKEVKSKGKRGWKPKSVAPEAEEVAADKGKHG